MTAMGNGGAAHRRNEYPVPSTMKAWVLGGPEELSLVEKPVPEPGRAEVLVRVDAIAVCATDIEIHAARPAGDGRRRIAVQQKFHDRPRIYGHDRQARAHRWTNSRSATAIAVEVHAGCGRCPRCREGMYTSCLNYGFRVERTPCQRLQHRWRLRRICGQQCQHDGPYPGRHDGCGSDADRHGRHRDVRARRDGRADRRRRRRGDRAGADRVDGGRRSPRRSAPQPVILTGTRDRRLEMGRKLGADAVVNVRSEDAGRGGRSA